MVANPNIKKVDAYESINLTLQKGKANMITIETMLQFGIFLIACIALVIKIVDLNDKKYLPNFKQVDDVNQ